MKRIILFSLLLLPMITVAAQESRFTFGVNAGINHSFSSFDIWKYSDIDREALGIKQNTEKGLIGFQIGLNVEYRLNRTFYLQSGLSYIMKRTQLKYIDLGNAGVYYKTDNLNTGYLKVPLLIALKSRIGTNTHLYFRGGAYFAQGISGKYKSTERLVLPDETTRITKKSHSIFGENYFQRFDWGLSFGTGIEIRRFVIEINYAIGLQNILKDSHSIYALKNDSKYKNRTLSLTAGYRF